MFNHQHDSREIWLKIYRFPIETLNFGLLSVFHSVAYSTLCYSDSMPIDSPFRRQHSYLVSIWVDIHPHNLPVWCGAIVTEADQRLHFSTLAELNRWISELSGWQDPPLDEPDVDNNPR